MIPRMDMPTFRKLTPVLAEALGQAAKAVKAGGLGDDLVELVKLRASQINGCAFCVGMHVAEARKAGLDEGKMLMLPTWREASLFSDRERAALDWAEALTLVSQTHVPDPVFEEVCRHFTDAKLAQLTAAIVVVNSWNRVAVAYRFTQPRVQ